MRRKGVDGHAKPHDFDAAVRAGLGLLRKSSGEAEGNSSRAEGPLWMRSERSSGWLGRAGISRGGNRPPRRPARSRWHHATSLAGSPVDHPRRRVRGAAIRRWTAFHAVQSQAEKFLTASHPSRRNAPITQVPSEGNPDPSRIPLTQRTDTLFQSLTKSSSETGRDDRSETRGSQCPSTEGRVIIGDARHPSWGGLPAAVARRSVA